VRVSGKRHRFERTANAMAEENRRLKRMYADVSMRDMTSSRRRLEKCMVHPAIARLPCVIVWLA